MKQSKRATLPKIIPVAPIDELIRLRKMFEAIFFAHPFGLPSFDYRSFKEGEAYLLLVGPEGDFSAREKEFLREISAIPISLGPRRLRTETAAVAFLVKALCVSREI
jgi:16S rRNA (uracil1498-N3)-methyltransferase